MPVIYVDARKKPHGLKWYQVLTMVEQPAPHEMLHGLQYCALTRVLKAAEVMRSIRTYLDEKASGRRERAIFLVGGITDDRIREGLIQTRSQADDEGLERLALTPIITALDPKTPPTVTTLEIASLPDNFDAEEMFKQYVTTLALGLFVDYGELAPLPGGNLGTSSQSQIMHLKTRGKGPALFMRLFEHLMNFGGVIPDNVQFAFEEQDIEADKSEAEVLKLRAEARGLMIGSGEIDAGAARQLAVDKGDIPQELFDELGQRDVTGPPPTRSDVVVDDATTPDRRSPGTGRLEEGERAIAPVDRAGPDDDRLELEERVQKRLARALATVNRNANRDA
jgi:hypothetical protein